MKKVKDILNSKQDLVLYHTTPETMVWDAIELMSNKSVGALVVIENSKLMGIVTERDYLRKVALLGRSSQTTPVRDIMTPDPIMVDIDESMEHCMELMIEKRIRHLPVMRNHELFGIVSIGDLLVNIMEDQKNMIKQLEQYIRGESY